jgi:hypothetical protein
MIMGDALAPTDPPTRASLEDLDQAFDAAVADLAEWQRAEAAETLAALRTTLPPLAGHIDAARVRRMIAVFVPSDVIGVHEAARIAGRSPERIRQLCRSGEIGHLDATKRRYSVSRRLLDEYKRWRPV